MNEYKITYVVDGKTYTTNRVERTEAIVRRNFLKDCKTMGVTVAKITGIELIRDDACATKQQERDTLETIKKMVAELGPQSYLATAFEGVFQDAESNIENDFGDSMQRRWERAVEKISAAQEEINRLKKQIKNMELDNRDLRISIERVKKEDIEIINALREQTERTLSSDDIFDICGIMASKMFELEEEVSDATERIVEAAEQPESAAFRNAVKEHRAAKANLDYYRAIHSRVDALRQKKAGTE